MILLFEIIGLVVVLWSCFVSGINNVPDLAYNIIMGVSGLLYVYSVRRKHFLYPVYGIIFSVLYLIKMYELKILAEFGFNLFYSVPVLLYAIYTNYQNREDSTHIKLKDKCDIRLYLLLPVFYGVVYKLLEYFGGTSISLDALSTTFVFMATLLMTLRYKNAFIFWSLANGMNTILHYTRGNNVLALVFGVYLINGILGYIAWNKKKSQS